MSVLQKEYADLLLGIGPKSPYDAPSIKLSNNLDVEEMPNLEGEIREALPGVAVRDICWAKARRPVALVSDWSGKRYVVKFMQDKPDKSSGSSVMQEAKIIKLLYEMEHEGANKNVRSYISLPKVLNVNSQCCTYTYCEGEPYDPLLNWKSKTNAKAVSRAIGDTLGTIHDFGRRVNPSIKQEMELIFPIPDHGYFTLEEASRGIGIGHQLFLRAYQECEDGLSELRRAWTTDDLIHYDLRKDNIIVRQPGDISVIDWEAAGLGNGCYDLAMICYEIVRASLEVHKLQLEGSLWLKVADSIVEPYCQKRKLPLRETRLQVLRYISVAILLRVSEKLQIVGCLNKIDALLLLSSPHLLAEPEKVVYR